MELVAFGAEGAFEALDAEGSDLLGIVFARSAGHAGGFELPGLAVLLLGVVARHLEKNHALLLSCLTSEKLGA